MASVYFDLHGFDCLSCIFRPAFSIDKWVLFCICSDDVSDLYSNWWRVVSLALTPHLPISMIFTSCGLFLKRCNDSLSLCFNNVKLNKSNYQCTNYKKKIFYYPLRVFRKLWISNANSVKIKVLFVFVLHLKLLTFVFLVKVIILIVMPF